MRNTCVWGLLMASAGWCQMLDVHSPIWARQLPDGSQGDKDLFPTPQMGNGRWQDDPPDLRPSERPRGESVSVTRLQHKVPKKARKLYLAARKLSQDGEHGKAAEELETVVLEDPEFADAYTSRAVEYVHLGRFADAKQSLQRAVEIDGHSWEAHFDLGLVLYQLGDLRGAEMRAYRALDLSRANPLIHVFLGYLLCMRAETRGAGLEHVQYAARVNPAQWGVRKYCPEPAP